jgi:hypothetical protein
MIFFMQKISGTSSGKNNKSCWIFTTNPTKLSLHFADFSMILYEFYNILQNSNTIGDPLLHRVLGKVRDLTNMPLVCA